MAKLVYATDLKSVSSDCGFDSRWRHHATQSEYTGWILFYLALR